MPNGAQSPTPQGPLTCVSWGQFKSSPWQSSSILKAGNGISPQPIVFPGLQNVFRPKMYLRDSLKKYCFL